MEQLVSQVRQVSGRLDSLIAEVAHNRQAMNWAKVMSLLEEAAQHPRDLNTIVGLAGVAPALEQVFYFHAYFLDTLTRCNETLHGLPRDVTLWNDPVFPQPNSQFLASVRQISERLDTVIAGVTLDQGALHTANLLLLVQEIKRNPRDIAFVTRLARVAPDLQRFFQLHQTVINIVVECNDGLHRLLSETF